MDFEHLNYEAHAIGAAIHGLILWAKDRPTEAMNQDVEITSGDYRARVITEWVPGGPEPDDNWTQGILLTFDHNIDIRHQAIAGVARNPKVIYFTVGPPEGYDPFEEEM